MTNSSLNVMRAVAALMVVVVHVRGFLLIPLAETNGGVINNVMYVATSLGNGAVMVFFVLSGYFVGGSVIRQRMRGSFRWSEYLIARGTRLWVVLIPALFLTFALDMLGRVLYPGSPSYDAASRALVQGDPFTFLGNALFLQAWVVEPFGSNGPLWSLAFEWTYYLLFPLLVIGIFRRNASWKGRTAAAILGVLVGVLAGPVALILFGAWLLGALVAWQSPRLSAVIASVSSPLLQVARVGAVLVTLLAMVLDRAQGGGSGYVAVGTILCAICAAALVVLFINDVHPQTRPARAALGFVDRNLAESSYSLYAYHMPVLLLIATAITSTGPTNRFEPNLLGWSLVIGITLALALGGWCFAQLTEHHYHSIRGRLLAPLRAQRPASASANADHQAA
ncbi:acyltransferase family protein [Microbacterium sp. LMI1-1-1.1]|uniref:acyltransferase family protein n=1 Tax=Microbacterium sp. LMI1-1-1.1 TaxID=3135223 RepID=UPI0034662437